MTPEQTRAWDRFCRETGEAGTPAFVGAFGEQSSAPRIHIETLYHYVNRIVYTINCVTVSQ